MKLTFRQLLSNRFSTRKNPKFIYLIGALLVILFFSLFVSPIDQPTRFRTLRVLVSLTSLLFVWRTNNINYQRRIIYFMLFYSLSSAIIIWYEVPQMAYAAMILNTVAYAILIRELISLIDFRKISRVFYVVLLAGAILYALLLVEFIRMLSEIIIDQTLIVLIVISTFMSFFLGVITFCYNHVYNTSRSITFTFFLIFVVFSEMFRGIAYYKFIDELIGQYSARLLLVIGFAFLSLYALNKKDNDIPLMQIKRNGRV